MDIGKNQETTKTYNQGYQSPSVQLKEATCRIKPQQKYNSGFLFRPFRYTIKYQHISPFGYGSKFRNPNVIVSILKYHEDKENMVRVIQEASHYHLTPIEDESRMSCLEEIILRGNQNSSKSTIKTATMEKEM